jgi:hypothetical protein
MGQVGPELAPNYSAPRNCRFSRSATTHTASQAASWTTDCELALFDNCLACTQPTHRHEDRHRGKINDNAERYGGR